MTALAALALGCSLVLQLPTPPAPAEGTTPEPAGNAGMPPLERFKSLDAEQRSAILRRLERRVQLDPDPVIQAIVSHQREFEHYPVAAARQAHDAARWAPGVAPARTLVPQGAAAHDVVRERVPQLELLPNMHKAVRYDWSTGQVVRRAEPLADHEVFDNLLHGYPPGSDAAVAAVLAELDADPKQRVLAAYLEHLYADLDGRAYEGVTLYEAWYSGEVVDVPDVDAVPFAVQVLNDRSFRSPIPGGPRRQRLYQRIREHTLQHRVYRTLREAAAAALVAAEPALRDDYGNLVPRLHLLWADAGGELKAFAKALARFADRDALLTTVDRALADPEVRARRDAHREALAAMAAKLRALALESLAHSGQR